MWYRRRQTRIVSALIAAVIAIVLLLTSEQWRTPELKAYDFRFRIIDFLGMGPATTTGKVVVVGIDEKDIIKDKPLIFLYSDIGQFLLKMRDFGVSVIAIDIIPFNEYKKKLKNGILALNEVMTDSRENITEEIGKKLGKKLDDSLLKPIMLVTETLPIVQAIFLSQKKLPFFYSNIPQFPFSKNISLSDVGLSDSDFETNDGVIRRQLLHCSDQQYKTFAGEIFRLISGNECREESVLLNYSLAKNIPFYFFSDVMNGKVDKDAFKDKAVILGYLNGYEDIFAAPVGRSIIDGESIRSGDIPGPLIHAVIIETLLTKTPLQEASLLLGIIVLFLLIAVGWLLSIELRPVYSMAGVLLVMAVFFLVNVILFAQGLVIPIFPHLMAPVFALTFIYPYRYFNEDRIKNKIYKTFTYYISGDVLDSILKKDPVSLLKGDKKNLCILFLDIRDSTPLSTREPAEKIVEFLNIYFEKITAIIQEHQGFVNRFIGDGVLAFFASGERRVANAIMAAQEILRETEKLNTEGTLRPIIGDWLLNIGIGIHYGSAVVGNIGSEKKMDFAIIGENVNLAARIEGLTKDLKKKVLVSGEAYEMVKTELVLEFLGEYSVKGIEKPISIYTFSEG